MEESPKAEVAVTVDAEALPGLSRMRSRLRRPLRLFPRSGRR
jgi:hypothetical protein